ncbi:MAG: hypothetical protein ABGW92_03100 [Methanocaldococcus sp.]
MRTLIIPIILFLIVGLCGCTSQVNEKINNDNTSINTTTNAKNTTNKKNETILPNKYEYRNEINLSKEDEKINNLINSSIKNIVLIDYNREKAMFFDPMIIDKYKINISNKELSTLIYNISSEPKFDYMISLYSKLKNNGWEVIRAAYDETTPDNRKEFEMAFKKDNDFLSITIDTNPIDNSTELFVEYLH